MGIIFGPDNFTVGADQDIDTYPTGSPDYAYSRGSGSNITVSATNDRAQSAASATDFVARCIDPAVPANMGNQQGTASLFANTTGATASIALRYSSSTRGYIGALIPFAANEVAIYEDDGGYTELASADRGLLPNVTYPASFRAVGGNGGAWFTLIINSTVAVTLFDTTAINTGAPGIANFGNIFPTDIGAVDDFQVDDLAGFPLVAGISSTNGSTATTSPVINLPSNIVSGETLLMLIRNAEGGTVTFPTGWNEMVEDSTDASNDTTAIAWKKSNGAEGGTLTMTSAFSVSGKFAAIVYRVLNAANPSMRPPEFATIVTGTSTTPDPGTITPTGGSKRYLFIWMGGWEGIQTSPPASFPTNYNSPVGADSGVADAVTTNCRVATAHREAEVSSEDPGTWTLSASDDWTATVVAIHPAEASMGYVIPNRLRPRVFGPGLAR